jgi:hypothetical protein
MPATTDVLLMKIKQLELQIQETIKQGQDASALQEQLNEMKSSFMLKNEALSNKSNILKG